MDVAIGLPNAVPGTTGEQLTEWARRAEARGFSSLGTIDRIAYPNLEPLVALAAAAAVTERIGLATTVLLGPLRRNPVALAKQVASLHSLSGHRMTLGIGLGGRDDDYEIAEVDTSTRGRDLDAMLERIWEVWKGDEMGPDTASHPRVLVGGSVEASFKRAARRGSPRSRRRRPTAAGRRPTRVSAPPRSPRTCSASWTPVRPPPSSSPASTAPTATPSSTG
jgi:alkanesulfonate monooxygenase SsuD/methylene tetrahydromethanopterin reductase-like flavin-dependent oxidoreductase (luciferase family)